MCYKSYQSKQIGRLQMKEESIKVPKFSCATCTNCDNSRCSVLNRYVEVDYNKCFKHSNYITNPLNR